MAPLWVKSSQYCPICRNLVSHNCGKRAHGAVISPGAFARVQARLPWPVSTRESRFHAVSTGRGPAWHGFFRNPSARDGPSFLPNVRWGASRSSRAKRRWLGLGRFHRRSPDSRDHAVPRGRAPRRQGVGMVPWRAGRMRYVPCSPCRASVRPPRRHAGRVSFFRGG